MRICRAVSADDDDVAGKPVSIGDRRRNQVGGERDGAGGGGQLAR